MRKFLIVLAMVAMVSFLLVGCNTGTTPVTPVTTVEPELQLTGITVDPKTMDLFAGEEKSITSVTATYELKGYGVEDVDFNDCLFLTSDSKVATVSKVGKVKAVAEGTADILVSYEGKMDTVKVTVTKPKSMEIIADMPLFEVGVEKGYRVEIVANDDVDKTVLVYLTLPDEADVYYWEVAAPAGDEWKKLEGDVVFGPAEGFVLVDNMTNFFKAEFNEVGTYETTVEVWTITGAQPNEVKVEKLCSKVISATVIPALPTL